MSTTNLMQGTALDCGLEWYALYTRHQHEKNVARVLGNKGFEIFLPLYRATHRWCDRNKELSLPLFPCYVFLRAVWDQRLRILTTPGVYSFVEFGGQPAPITEGEITAIRRAVEESDRVEPHPYLRCGDWVRVKSGPLEGIEGILVRIKGRSRLVLSVDMLAKSVAVEVDSALVERTSRRVRIIEPNWAVATQV